MHSLGKIQQSFQRALQSYNDNASLQRSIANRLLTLALHAGLPTQNHRVLEIGCGTGFLTQQLATQITIEQLFINDLISDCEHYVRDLIPISTQSEFLAGSIEDIKIPKQLDLICSASTLQWVKNLPELLQKLTQQLNTKGYLILSSFTKNHFIEIRSLQNDEPDIQYPLNYWSTSQWREALTKDYEVLIIQSKTHIAYFNSVKELLMHLRLTGVNGNSRQRWTQQKFKQFEKAYSEKFQENGKFKLSYNPIYIIAQKRIDKKSGDIS